MPSGASPVTAGSLLWAYGRPTLSCWAGFSSIWVKGLTCQLLQRLLQTIHDRNEDMPFLYPNLHLALIKSHYEETKQPTNQKSKRWDKAPVLKHYIDKYALVAFGAIKLIFFLGGFIFLIQHNICIAQFYYAHNKLQIYSWYFRRLTCHLPSFREPFFTLCTPSVP